MHDMMNANFQDSIILFHLHASGLKLLPVNHRAKKKKKLVNVMGIFYKLIIRLTLGCPLRKLVKYLLEKKFLKCSKI